MLKPLLMLAVLLLPARYASAHEYSAGQLHIAHPWSMELPPNAPTVAVYFIVHNNGKSADRLTGVHTPIAGEAQFHESSHVNGMMKMQQVTAVEIAAGADASFAPMGYHVMLLDVKDRSKLTDGQRFPLTLHFEKAGDITVEVSVQKQPPTATGQPVHQH